jgi:hypothetical protein
MDLGKIGFDGRWTEMAQKVGHIAYMRCTRNACNVLVRKSKEKRPPGRSKHR